MTSLSRTVIVYSIVQFYAFLFTHWRFTYFFLEQDATVIQIMSRTRKQLSDVSLLWIAFVPRKARWPKTDKGDGRVYVRKAQSCVLCCVRRARLSVTCRRVIRIRIWPSKRDQRSGALIGAGGTWRSDWSERVLAFGVRWRARVLGVAAVCTRLLQVHQKELIFHSRPYPKCSLAY